MCTVRKHRVSIKVVPTTSEELRIARMLSSEEHAHNNHCVPVLDVLPDPTSSSHALLVMPFLRPFDDPQFEVVEEAVEFIRQTLEVRLYPEVCVLRLILQYIVGIMFHSQSRSCTSVSTKS